MKPVKHIYLLVDHNINLLWSAYFFITSGSPDLLTLAYSGRLQKTRYKHVIIKSLDLDQFTWPNMSAFMSRWGNSLPGFV